MFLLYVMTLIKRNVESMDFDSSSFNDVISIPLFPDSDHSQTREFSNLSKFSLDKISNRLTGNLPALVYLAELRAIRFVHPTLRKRAKMIADTLLELFGKFGLVIHLDKEIDRFDIKRGEHDIVLKKNVY